MSPPCSVCCVVAVEKGAGVNGWSSEGNANRTKPNRNRVANQDCCYFSHPQRGQLGRKSRCFADGATVLVTRHGDRPALAARGSAWRSHAHFKLQCRNAAINGKLRRLIFVRVTDRGNKFASNGNATTLWTTKVITARARASGRRSPRSSQCYGQAGSRRCTGSARLSTGAASHRQRHRPMAGGVS
jgi:hypothetical protein